MTDEVSQGTSTDTKLYSRTKLQAQDYSTTQKDGNDILSEKQYDCVWQKQTLVDKGLQGDRYSGVLAVIQAGGINCYLHFLLFFSPSLFFQVFHNE